MKTVIDEHGVSHDFPDDATDAEINAALGPPKAAFSPAIFENTPFSAANPFGAFLSNDRARSALPQVGGFAGSMVGGPVGAGAGGAIGEGIRQAASGERLNPLGMAGQGAGQAALEYGGILLGKGAGAAAKGIMRRVVRPTPTLAQKYPDIVETLLKNKTPVTKQGLKQIEQLRGQSSDELYNILRGQTAAGTTIPTAQVASKVGRSIANKAVPNAEKKAIQAQLDDFLAQHGDELTPLEVKEIKRLYQPRASAARAASKEGMLPEAERPAAAFNSAISRGSRGALETVPGVAAQEANTRSLIGAGKAVEQATLRNPPMADITKPLTWPVIEALGSKSLNSNIAILLSRPSFQALAKQSPRLAVALIQQAAYSAPSDATSGN